VLGVMVVLVAIKLIKLNEMREIRKESPYEFWLAVMTAVVVVVVGVEQGIVLAMIFSLLRVVRHSYHPHSGVLEADGKGMWNLIPVAPGVVTEPGLVFYRFGAELFYANADRFSEEILSAAKGMTTKDRWIIVDAQAITHVDYSASRVVMDLKKILTEEGVALGFARMPWDMRSDFARHQLTETIGQEWIFNHLHDARAAFKKLSEPEYTG
jgi:sulfate permease, SulP family